VTAKMSLAKFHVRRPVRLLTAVVLGASIGINVVAFMQVWAMTHFAETGERTARPEQLDTLGKLTVILSGVVVPRPQNRRTPSDVGLAYETRRFRSAGGSLLEAWYVPGKNTRPVVALFHGYGASKSSLLPAGRVFHGLGYSTLLVDFFGSGGSSGSGTTIGVKESGDVVATFDYIRRTWPNRKLVLYGISMGGAAVLRAIGTEKINPDAVIVEATFDSLLNTGKSRFRALGLPASPFAELLMFWGSVQTGSNLFLYNPAEYARSVNCPTLILHGEKDERATLDQARAIAGAMGQNARFVSFAGVPHMAIVEARPVDWTREVRDFMHSF
jgi:uncharacterized protein